MPSVTIQNVPDEVHRAIRVRAAQHGRSIEAGMRDILESAVEEFAIFESVRGQTPARAVSFE